MIMSPFGEDWGTTTCCCFFTATFFFALSPSSFFAFFSLLFFFLLEVSEAAAADCGAMLLMGSSDLPDLFFSFFWSFATALPFLTALATSFIADFTLSGYLLSASRPFSKRSRTSLTEGNATSCSSLACTGSDASCTTAVGRND